MVSQNVAFHGLNERNSATFQALEEIDSTEADESLSTAGEVVQLPTLGTGRRLWRRLADVVCQSVSGKFQAADGLRDRVRI